jgi:uncharacterized protein YgiM (DUF1202 family)
MIIELDFSFIVYNDHNFVFFLILFDDFMDAYTGGEALRGMQPIIECWFPERLCVGLHLTILRACAWGRARKWAMLMLLTVVMFPWPSVGETANPAPSCAPKHAASSLRRGRVILPSTLRSSPSVQSEIVGVVKEGVQVRILLESGRWYQVMSENGVEAWIYKPLVVVEQEPIQEPSGLPEALNPLDIEDTTSAAASATPDAVVEFLLENTTDALGLAAGTAELVDEPHVPP